MHNKGQDWIKMWHCPCACIRKHRMNIKLYNTKINKKNTNTNNKEVNLKMNSNNDNDKKIT